MTSPGAGCSTAANILIGRFKLGLLSHFRLHSSRFFVGFQRGSAYSCLSAAEHSNNHVFHHAVFTHDPEQQHARQQCSDFDKSKAVATLLLDQASDIAWRLDAAANAR